MKEQTQINPDYYQLENGFEAIDIIDALDLTKGFCVGNAIKYLIREGRKDGELTQIDVQKAIWYLDHYIKRLKKLEADNEQKNAQAELLVCKD